MAEARVLRGHGGLAAVRKSWRKYSVGYLFLLPAAILYAIFMVYPFLQSVYLSLTDWDGAQPVKRFVGLRNFQTLIQDALVWTSLGHNLIWVVIGTIVPVVIGLLLGVTFMGRPRGF